MKILTLATLLLASIYAIDEPLMKEGLWSIHIQSVDNPGNKKSEGARSICRSHAYDLHTREIARQAKSKCKVIEEKNVGNKIISDTECSVGTTVLRTKGTVTMTSDMAAHSETVTTYNPAMGGLTESTMIMDQKYVGACPAGVQPGDSIGQDGRITHLWKK
jgi:hypothetical protein